MFIARLRADALRAGCLSSRSAVVRMETKVEERGGESRRRMKRGEVKEQLCLCNANRALAKSSLYSRIGKTSGPV